MHGKLARKSLRRRKAIGRWMITLVSAIVSFVFLVVFHSRNIPFKWVTATIGTIISFSFVLYGFRHHLLKWQFWVAFAICLGVHAGVIWILFQYALAGVERLSIWLWFPVVIGETVVLLIAVKRIFDTLRGQSEQIKLS